MKSYQLFFLFFLLFESCNKKNDDFFTLENKYELIYNYNGNLFQISFFDDNDTIYVFNGRNNFEPSEKIANRKVKIDSLKEVVFQNLNIENYSKKTPNVSNNTNKFIYVLMNESQKISIEKSIIEPITPKQLINELKK